MSRQCNLSYLLFLLPTPPKLLGSNIGSTSTPLSTYFHLLTVSVYSKYEACRLQATVTRKLLFRLYPMS